jgi:hypothetical protein
MRPLRRFRTLPALFALALLIAVCAHGSLATRASAATQAPDKFRVYCVNGKVDFGNRTLQEMQWDFGKNVCLLHEYDSYRDAKEDARRRGGVGAACSCQ